MRTFTICTIACLTTALTSFRAQAQYTMTHQGQLTNLGGDPINSTLTFVFKLYKGGVQVWSETQAGVSVVDGIYGVELGSVTPFDTLSFNAPLELGITVGADPEMSPRQILTASPVAHTLRNLRVKRVIGPDGNTVNLIGGHEANDDSTGVEGATIAGGGRSIGPNKVSADYGTIGGGTANRVGGWAATIAGGTSNTAKGFGSVVGGGGSNKAGGVASTVSGGEGNRALETSSTVVGGFNNLALGYASTVVGGHLNRADGYYSLAAGRGARAKHSGSFVWSSNVMAGQDTMVTTAPQQFLIHSPGGVGIGTNGPTARMHVTQAGVGVTSDDVYNDDIVVEDQDAILGLYSSSSGSFGSGIILAEMNSGSFVSGWNILRTTSNATNANDLFFRYGSDENYANNSTALILRDNGDLVVTGNISKGGGSFKIDHPLDPKNQYLYHSFVESPDMMNVYNGIVRLDADGGATVAMPDYFEALNRDFRYQLTCIGSYAPVFVATKIDHNVFRIEGGTAGLEVSWQVTGVRKDPYAEMHRIEVEVDKTGNEIGAYLHPDAYLSNAKLKTDSLGEAR